jgi:hypothetical protein
LRRAGGGGGGGGGGSDGGGNGGRTAVEGGVNAPRGLAGAGAMGVSHL